MKNNNFLTAVDKFLSSIEKKMSSSTYSDIHIDMTVNRLSITNTNKVGIEFEGDWSKSGYDDYHAVHYNYPHLLVLTEELSSKIENKIIDFLLKYLPDDNHFNIVENINDKKCSNYKICFYLSKENDTRLSKECIVFDVKSHKISNIELTENGLLKIDCEFQNYKGLAGYRSDLVSYYRIISQINLFDFKTGLDENIQQEIIKFICALPDEKCNYIFKNFFKEKLTNENKLKYLIM